MSHKIDKQLTIKPNARAKQSIKRAMLVSYSKNTSNRFSVAALRRIPTPALVLTLVAILLVSTLFGVNLSRNPLTADRVIAHALEAIDKSKSQGQWQFTKTKEEITINGKTTTTHTETWSNTNMSKLATDSTTWSNQEVTDYSSKTTLEDGRILSEMVMVNNKSYERDTRAVMKEVMGYDPYSITSPENAPLPPGFKEAGLKLDSLDKLSMKEIDDALKAAGQKAMFESTFKTTNFPAYTMKPADLNKLLENADQKSKNDPHYFDSLYGGADNYVSPPNMISTPDGRSLEGSEADKYMADQQSTYQSMDTLRTGTLEDKRKALETLRTKGNIKLIKNASWDGRAAIGIDLTQVSNDPQVTGGSQILYLDAKTYQMIGEEYAFDTSNPIYAMPTGMQMPSHVRITYLQQYYTNVRPAFSTEGLTPIEQLYNLSTSAKPQS
jgi:hypothetical protein